MIICCKILKKILFWKLKYYYLVIEEFYFIWIIVVFSKFMWRFYMNIYVMWRILILVYNIEIGLFWIFFLSNFNFIFLVESCIKDIDVIF